jgi:hypothetical protein
MREAPGFSETSVLTRATRRNNPEDTILHVYIYISLVTQTYDFIRFGSFNIIVPVEGSRLRNRRTQYRHFDASTAVSLTLSDLAILSPSLPR